VKCDDIGPARRHACETQGRLDGFRTRIGKEDAVKLGGQDLAHALDQFEQWAMHNSRVLGVNDATDLFLGSGNHRRVTVTGACHTNTRREIEIASAINVNDPTSSGVVNDYRGCLLEQRT
jgi:hypothetical protein